MHVYLSTIHSRAYRNVRFCKYVEGLAQRGLKPTLGRTGSFSRRCLGVSLNTTLFIGGSSFELGSFSSSSSSTICGSTFTAYANKKTHMMGNKMGYELMLMRFHNNLHQTGPTIQSNESQFFLSPLFYDTLNIESSI